MHLREAARGELLAAPAADFTCGDRLSMSVSSPSAFFAAFDFLVGEGDDGSVFLNSLHVDRLIFVDEKATPHSFSALRFLGERFGLGSGLAAVGEPAAAGRGRATRSKVSARSSFSSAALERRCEVGESVC